MLAQKLSQVEGVGQVFVGGGARPAVRARVDPNAARPARASASRQVRAALARRQRQHAQGRAGQRDHGVDDQRQRPALRRRPVPAGDRRLPERRPRAAGRHRPRSRPRWRTCARRGSPTASARCSSSCTGSPAPTSSTRWTASSPCMPELRASIPPADQPLGGPRPHHHHPRLVPGHPAHAAPRRSSLVVLVVFVFLRSASATVIPSVAVPLSLLGTFAGMYLLGYSLDNLSLMALTVVHGLRGRRRHRRAREHHALPGGRASRPWRPRCTGSREIGFTVLSMSTSLVAVFIPILLMGGLVGPALPRVRRHARRSPSASPCSSRSPPRR